MLSWGFGPGGSCLQKSRPPGGGVESLGRGLGRGGSELSRVCRGAAERNRWLGRGEGTWRGGGGVRGPEDEERGISTPRVSQEKPPSPSLSCKSGGQRRPFSRRARPLACRGPRCAAGRPRARPSPLGRPPAPAGRAGSRPPRAARGARVNGAAPRGARGRREAGSRAGSEFRDRK